MQGKFSDFYRTLSFLEVVDHILTGNEPTEYNMRVDRTTKPPTFVGNFSIQLTEEQLAELDNPNRIPKGK